MDKEEMKSTEDELILCPMLKKNIPDCLCYEINLVVKKDAIKSFVPEIKDWDKAERTCPSCKVSFYNK